jgi:mRNA interferase MazF
MNIDLQETQNIIDATKEQIYLQGKTHGDNRAKPRRGQVFNCHLGVGVGSEFQKRRPCVVLSNTVSNINTSMVVVAPITHTQRNYPVFVPITDKLDASGTVILGGYADLSAIRSISSYRLAGFICELNNDEMRMIDAATAGHLDLMRHYNALIKAGEDREKYIAMLVSILSKLRNMTGTETNQGLIGAVERLINDAK